MRNVFLAILTVSATSLADNLPKINEEKTIVATIHGEARALDKQDRKLIDDVRWSLRNEKGDDLKYMERAALRIKNKRHKAFWLETFYLARQLFDYPECQLRKLWLANHCSQVAKAHCGGERSRCSFTEVQEKEIY